MNKNRKQIISQNITKYRTLKGITQKELAEAIDISPSTLSDYMHLRSAPSHGVIQKIADYFDIKKSDIDTTYKEERTSIATIYNKLEPPRQQKVYTFAEHQLEEQQKPEIKETVVPYISLLSAGTGVIDLDPTHENEEVYNGYVPKHDLAFKVSGDSMEPLFENGELVFVEKTSDIHNGQVIAVQINEEAYIKKAYIEEDKLRLVSLNKEYEDVYASKDDDIRIVGRVLL